MALLPEDRERIKYHLGYLGTSTAASLSFGLSTPIQTLFILEQAMNNMPEVGVPRVRRMITIMDNIECKLVEAQDHLAASKLGEMTLERKDGTEPDLLEKEYWRWGGRLADHFGVPFYAYSNRYKNQGGMMAGSIPVRH